MTRAARVPAYAKINLGLRVLYQRPDGFHEIRTVFQTISLADRLDISCTLGRVTSVSVEGTPDIADNIAARAAHGVLEALGLRARVRIGLRKRIPTGAGLGGGSSDAAAVLLALPVLAGRNLRPDVLTQLALRLGSDVPFFLYGGRAVGLGRGEELYPLPEGSAVRGLLVAPAIHSSTAEAYRDLSAELTLIQLQNKLNSFRSDIWQSGKIGAANDFESVVCARHPRIGQIRDRLRRLGANPAALTGSGSAVFGVFNDPERLLRTQTAFPQAAFPDDKIFAFSFLTRNQYRARWRRALAVHARPNRDGVPVWPLLSRYAG